MEPSIVYSESRGTWNVFLGSEWYYESEDYEQAEEVYFNCCAYNDDEN